MFVLVSLAKEAALSPYILYLGVISVIFTIICCRSKRGSSIKSSVSKGLIQSDRPVFSCHSGACTMVDWTLLLDDDVSFLQTPPKRNFCRRVWSYIYMMSSDLVIDVLSRVSCTGGGG